MNDLQSPLQSPNYPPNYQVESSLGDVARALWRRKWIIILVTLIFLVAAHFYTQHLPKQWQAQAQLLLVQRPDAGSDGPRSDAYIAPEQDSVATQIGMLQTAEMADRALSWLKNEELQTGQTQDTTGVSLGSLQSSVTVVNPTGSDLINIAVLGSSRDQALLLTNAVAHSFVQWKAEQAREDVQTQIRKLTPRTEAARRQMDIARTRQLAYQKGHNILDSGSQAAIGIHRLAARTEEVASLQSEMDAEQTTANSLKAQLDKQNSSIQATGPRDDNYITTLKERLSDLKLQRADLARRVTPAYPGKLPILDQQISDIQRQLDTAVKATLNGNNSSLASQALLNQNYQAAQTQLATTQKRLSDAVALKNEATAAMTPLVETGSTYEQVAREAQEATTTYAGLEAALQSARLRENQINGDIQITQSAVAPDAPSKPNPSLNLLMGGLLGLLASLAIVFIIEQLDRRVRTEDQVERLGSGPILGALPRLSRSALALLDRKQLPIPVAESYSLAGANLLRVLGAPQTGQGRIVMVTSAQVGEGKSLTAAELARSLARSGKRVILVDADMRRPALSALFDNAPEEGLIEVLSGKVLVDDALAASETPNLSVLFNNSPRVNSADIIVSPHMTNFLQMIRSRADIVVLDTPSCTVVDPLLLAPSVDYVLQVIDLGRANEDAVNSTSSVLSGLAPLGLFINRTSKRNAPAYEIARSFAATQVQPGLPGGNGAAFPADHTLMMFRNTSGYTPGHLNGSDPLADARPDAGDMAIPLNREDH